MKEPELKLGPASGIPGSRIRAIANLAEEYPGTLRLFYGEDTLPTPDFIKKAGQAAIDRNLTYYTPNAGYLSLREVIADQVRMLHGVEIDPRRDVTVTASGMVAMVLAFQATLAAGDSAIVVTPLWPNISAGIQVLGAKAIEVPLAFSEQGFTLDLDRIEAAIEPSTKLIALASPGNPTGWTATREDWRNLLALCEKYDLWLLADGVYERLVSVGNVAPSPLSEPGGRERAIIAQSFSKAYRMTGWRVGYAIAPPPIAAVLPGLQEFIISHAAGIAQEAARVAIIEGEAFVAETRERYAKHREIAVRRLRSIEGIVVPEATGAFYVFPRFKGLTDSFAFCERLVREFRVGVAPGSAFGEGGEGHLRICFAVDEPTLNEAIDRLDRALESKTK